MHAEIKMSLPLIVFILILQSVHSAKQKDGVTYCGVCIAIMEEMKWEVVNTDPKAKVQIGSFRVDSKGNQQLQDIPLSKSESHLNELLENVCQQMTHYATANAEGTKRRIFARMTPRDGSPLAIDSLHFKPGLQDQMKTVCDNLVEDHEDDIVKAFQVVELKELSTLLCVDHFQLCNVQNITDYKHLISTAAPFKPPSDREDDDDNDDDDQDIDNKGEL